MPNRHPCTGAVALPRPRPRPPSSPAVDQLLADVAAIRSGVQGPSSHRAHAPPPLQRKGTLARPIFLGP